MRDTRRTRVVLVVLLVAALALIGLNYSDGSNPALRGLRSAGGTVFGGAEHAANSVASMFSGSSSSSPQVKSLQAQADKLRAELSGAELSKSDYAELRKLLLVAGAAQYKIVAASVIAVGTGYQQTVTLDVGSADGVRANETVLNGQGLVGRVVSVTSTTASVELATSAASVVGASVAPSGQLGVVSGPGATASGSGLMRLQMLSSSAALKTGDQLVTSASVRDKPYVPGVPIGVIARLISRGSLTEVAEVRPFVNFTALGVVGIVIVPPRHNPRFAALPPLPHPGPTVTVTVTARPGTRTGPPRRRRPRRAADVRKAWFAPVVIVLGIVLQLTVLNGLRLPGGGVPDLVLVLVCALAMAEGPLAGLIIGFAAGLSLDIAPPGSALIGQYALVFCLAGWAAGRLSSAAGRSALRSVVLLGGVVAAAEVLAAALARVLEPAQVTFAEVRDVLPATIGYDLVLCPFVLYLVLLASALLTDGLTAGLAGGGLSSLLAAPTRVQRSDERKRARLLSPRSGRTGPGRGAAGSAAPREFRLAPATRTGRGGPAPGCGPATASRARRPGSPATRAGP